MEFLGQSYLQNDTNLIDLREITYFNIYNENPLIQHREEKNKKTKQNKIRALKNKKMVKVYPPNIYLLKFNNRNARHRCEICSKFTTKTPERS